MLKQFICILSPLYLIMEGRILKNLKEFQISSLKVEKDVGACICSLIDQELAGPGPSLLFMYYDSQKHNIVHIVTFEFQPSLLHLFYKLTSQ